MTKVTESDRKHLSKKRRDSAQSRLSHGEEEKTLRRAGSLIGKERRLCAEVSLLTGRREDSAQKCLSSREGGKTLRRGVSSLGEEGRLCAEVSPP